MAYLVSPLIGGARMEAVGTPASPPGICFSNTDDFPFDMFVPFIWPAGMM
jgi:hypothetical protein